jgi:hypothetical protein
MAQRRLRDNAGRIAEDFNGATDFAMPFVKLSYYRTGIGQRSLKLADWLIPFWDSDRASYPNYDYRDQDLSFSGPVVPPSTDLILGAGKDGFLYVIDRENLGRQVGSRDNIANVVSALKIPPLYVTYNGSGIPTPAPSSTVPWVIPRAFRTRRITSTALQSIGPVPLGHGCLYGAKTSRSHHRRSICCQEVYCSSEKGQRCRQPSLHSNLMASAACQVA